jgi:hypothetical protein
MGEVFRASDTRLARKVAINAIRAGHSSARLELRLLGEARAASALNHPNIITIYDVGTLEGQPYIVMEWIEGQTLRQKLRRVLYPYRIEQNPAHSSWPTRPKNARDAASSLPLHSRDASAPRETDLRFPRYTRGCSSCNKQRSNPAKFPVDPRNQLLQSVRIAAGPGTQ